MNTIELFDQIDYWRGQMNSSPAQHVADSLEALMAECGALEDELSECRAFIAVTQLSINQLNERIREFCPH